MSRAEERSLGLAARKILSDMSKNKSEPQAPGVVDSFMRQLGGPEGFGEIIAEEIKKARGEIDPANAGHYKPSQHMTLKLLEMSSRIMLQNDDREETGFAHMSDEELLNTLRGLAVDLARNNPEFRRIIAIEAVRNQPDLIHELMNISGMPVVESAPESIEEDFRDAGLDEEDASVTNDD